MNETDSGRRGPLTLRVLVADPHDDTRSMYAEALAFAGCEVIQAADGGDALDKALLHEPRLVITETRLPLVDGYTLCESLRREPATRDVPILVITAEARDEQVARARAAGADVVLTKPVDPEVVLVAVRRLLTQRT